MNVIQIAVKIRYFLAVSLRNNTVYKLERQNYKRRSLSEDMKKNQCMTNRVCNTEELIGIIITRESFIKPVQKEMVAGPQDTTLETVHGETVVIFIKYSISCNMLY